ncbi:MAG: efflux RND transporter periplasmic adaptor subunit [bacterium]
MKKRTRVTVSITVVAMIAIATFLLVGSRRGPEQGPAEKDIVIVRKGTIEVKILATGTIHPFTRVEVRSPQKGRLEKVSVDEGDWVQKGHILALVSGEDRISLLDAANSMMQEAKATGDDQAIEKAKLARETAMKAYLPIPITSPLRARVIKRSCQPGQNVGPNDVLFVLSDRLVAGVEVDETDIGKIHVGQRAIITLDAFPEEKKVGKVVKISQEGRTVSNVVIYDVQVNPKSIPPNWSSGMTANVEFLIHDLKDVMVLPVSAVRQKGMSKMVMLAGENPHSQKIETGVTDGKMIEIKSGLSEGDSVLATGAGEPKGGGKDRSQALRTLYRWRRLSKRR